MRYRQYSLGLTGLAAGLMLSAPMEASAQSATAAAMLEEVVVTARRREENLQDLPLSISAISADAMQAQGIYNIADIGDSVPNLTFTTTDRRHVKAVYIRGIGNSRPVTVAPTGTGLYLDGHYMPNTVGQMMSTVDVERVEVLRGPQGTLFGRNTTGGAINIVSTKPQPEFGADIIARVGEYGQEDLRGMVNIPLSDTVFTRFSIANETSDGYFENRTLGRDVGGTDLEAFGAAVRWVPNDNWTIDLGMRANYQDDDDLGGQCRVHASQDMIDIMEGMYGVGGTSNNAAAQADWQANSAQWQAQSDGIGTWGGGNAIGRGHIERLYDGATLQFWNDCTTDNAIGPYSTSQEKDSYLQLDNEWLNATIAWDSNGAIGGIDNLNIKAIVSSQEVSLNYLQDRDMSSLSIDGIGMTPDGTRRLTDNFELLFTIDVNDRLSVVTGVNVFADEVRSGTRSPTGCLPLFEQNVDTWLAEIENDPDGLLPSFEVPCAPDGGGLFDRMGNALDTDGAPATSGRDGYEENDSLGIFAHVTYDLNDNWTMAVGGRQTDEDRVFHQLEFNSVQGTCLYDDPANGNPNPGAPLPTSICRPEFVLDRAALETGFYNNHDVSFSEFTPMISFTRALEGGDTIDSGQVYFSYSEGFLAGSFNDELNTILVPQAAPLVAYGPEHVDSWEVGFKGTLQDGRTRIATALFYMDYQDKQETVDINNADGRFGPDDQIEVTANASNVDIFGIELELRTQPWDGGYLAVDLAWLDNEYGDYAALDLDSGQIVDRSNLTIEDFSPEWTLNMVVEHAFELGNGATLTPQLGLYYQSEYDFVTAIDRSGPNSYCYQGGYSKLRARLTYEPADAAWQASLFGSNIADEQYFEICGAARTGVFDYRYGAPARWGLEFNYRWGS